MYLFINHWTEFDAYNNNNNTMYYYRAKAYKTLNFFFNLINHNKIF